MIHSLSWPLNNFWIKVLILIYKTFIGPGPGYIQTYVWVHLSMELLLQEKLHLSKVNSVQTPGNSGQQKHPVGDALIWDPACLSSAFLLRQEVRHGENMSGESRRSLCMQLSSLNIIHCLCHRLRLNWKIQEHVSSSDSCLSGLASPRQGETEPATIGSPDFTGRSLAAWA